MGATLTVQSAPGAGTVFTLVAGFRAGDAADLPLDVVDASGFVRCPKTSRFGGRG